MYLLTIPVSVAKKLEIIQYKFLWGNLEKRRRCHLVAWDKIKKPILHGGMGDSIYDGDEHDLIG